MIAGNPPELGYRTKQWTLEEYHRLTEIGGFYPENRTELIEGEIIEKMGAGPAHSNTVAELGDVLAALFGRGYHVREEKPITILDSEPEPDLAVVTGTRARFFTRHPDGNEVVLLVEVSDSSLPLDSVRKARLYARAGISEFWILDLNSRRLIVHRDPLSDGGWGEVRTHPQSARVSPLAATVDILVGDLLPPEDPVSA